MEYDAEDDRIGDDCLDLGGELLRLILGAAPDEGPAPLSAAAGASVVLLLGGVLDGGGTEILLDLRLLLVAFASTPSLIMIPVPFGLAFIGVLLLEDGPPAIGVGDDSLFAVNFCDEEPAMRRPTALLEDELEGVCAEPPAAMERVVGPRPLERLMQPGRRA